jgi:hypothetical protein
MTALATYDDQSFRMAIEPNSFDSLLRFATAFAKIGLCGAKSPEDALARMLYGRALGIPCMQSMALIHLIEGRPTSDAQLMLALCHRSDVCEYFEPVATDSKRATYRAKRKGRPEMTYAYSMDSAKASGLTARGTWLKYPEQMLRARCVSSLARMLFPDVIAGLYTPDEMADELPASSEVMASAVASAVAPAGEPPAAPRDFRAEADILKTRIASPNMHPEEIRELRAYLREWSKEAPADMANEVKTFYGMIFGKPKQSAAAESLDVVVT